MSEGPAAALMRAHRLLCLPFVEEERFRHALGGSRADIGAVARYLARPPHQRPDVALFFDAAFYLATNADVAEAGLDPLLHFLEYGIAEQRSPHPLIDLPYILAVDPQGLGHPPSIGALVDLLAYDLAAPSPYFDPAEYRERVGGEAPATGMLRHYLVAGIAAGLLPNRLLDPAWYAAAYEDVPADAYGALRHFIVFGDIDGRRASPRFDGGLYRNRYQDIAADGVAPLRHYLLHGRSEGRQLPQETMALPASPLDINPGEPLPVTAGSIALYTRMVARLATARQRLKEAVVEVPPGICTAESAAAGLAGLSFAAEPAPVISILIPVFNEIAITAECLAAIVAHAPAEPFEVVIADDASTDAEASLLAAVPGLVVVRQERNLGFLRNCNAAFRACRGRYVLLLNNDAQVLAGTIDRLASALDADPTIGAAGPKILYMNGRVQEAGCHLKPNGESGMVGLFGDPNEGGYCYDRDVPYCSGACLMVRRDLIGDELFDETYLPAYCEDADLCLRLIAGGYRVRYVHEAAAVHHLSVSTTKHSVTRKLRQVVRNQHKLVERWGDMLATMNRVRVLAFYLPQFHATPENDLWWGAGFTEWHNVAKARPSYVGHYQPHLPADLGWYDLTSTAALRRQAALATRYGVEGFVVYHYNFGERRVLHRPLETVRANPDIPFHWCLCWANENWTRHWDGGEREILLEQKYDDATLQSVIADALAQAADPRYLRVDGRPMFLVYRPLLIPEPIAFAAQCRAAFAAAGHPGVHLVYVESMEAVARAIRPADIGFDAAVEFPPHGLATPAADTADILKSGWSGYRYDYEETVVNFVTRPTVPYPRYPAVFPSWDNTPRQPLKGTSFERASPEAFHLFVEEKIEELRNFHMGDGRLLFVNAWNEWAEGTHLEPDAGHGHRWLEALAGAIAAKAWS